MKELLQSVKQIFESDGWTINVADEPPMIYGGYGGDSGQWIFYARQHEQDEQIVFYSLYPEPCPIEKREKMLVFLSIVNDGLIIGNFEYNFQRNEIRYKTSMEFKIATFTDEICRCLIYNNLEHMNTYFVGIYTILHQDIDPEEAMQLCLSKATVNYRES